MEQEVIRLIRATDLDGLKSLLEREPRALDVQGTDGVWAMHEAILGGNMEMIKYIVEYAIVNPNLRDGKGNQALHYGVRSGSLEVVRYLTERVGMSVTYGNLDGKTPLDIAVELGYREIQAYFEGRIGCAYENMYHNPVLRGMHPDPSIVRVGRDYYMVNSSFVFFPCIPISHSKDLVHWETIGYAITRADWAGLSGLEGGHGYWAPDISYDRGRFYITATYRLNDGDRVKRLQMVTSSERPEGPYEKPVFLDEDGIDPSIFTDVDGRRYMLLNRGARIFELSQDATEIISEPKLLWYGDFKKASEGPHMLYKDGYYYLFMAEGGTGRGHRITVARSKTLMGVYEPSPYNPILRQLDEQGLIQCAGHGKPVQTAQGDWYMVYLCVRQPDGARGIMGRETALDPMSWTADGWPVVNRLQGPSLIQKKPDIAVKKQEKQSTGAAVFPTDQQWGDWCMPRGTGETVFGTDEFGFFLQGDGADLYQLQCRSLLLKRQEEEAFVMTCRMRTDFLSAGMDCGLTCYYDENSYLKFGAVKDLDVDGIFVQEYVGDGYTKNCFVPQKLSGQVYLKIEADRNRRTLSYRLTKTEEWHAVTVLTDIGYLCSEGVKKGKRFTGAMAGIYVHGMARIYFEEFQIEYRNGE